jgi:hypothetical protein
MIDPTGVASRPILVKAAGACLAAGAVFMALLGWSASAYFVPAACLLLQAILLWSGRGFRLFSSILVISQVSGLLLVLVLWLGDGLGTTKLDIAGVMLLANLLCGGPLMAILGAALSPSLRRNGRLARWFRPALRGAAWQ